MNRKSVIKQILAEAAGNPILAGEYSYSDVVRSNVKCGLVDSMQYKTDSMFEILSAQREPDLLSDLTY